MELLKFILSDFWVFIGAFALLSISLHYPTNLILQIIHKLIRARTIRKVGYPPIYCDGDGDFRSVQKN